MKDYIVTKVYQFKVGDAEDPDFYAAEPILDWEKGEAGMFVMEHAIEPPTWHRHVDPDTYGYTYVITAKLPKEKYTFYKLKFD